MKTVAELRDLICLHPKGDKEQSHIIGDGNEAHLLAFCLNELFANFILTDVSSRRSTFTTEKALRQRLQDLVPELFITALVEEFAEDNFYTSARWVECVAAVEDPLCDIRGIDESGKWIDGKAAKAYFYEHASEETQRGVECLLKLVKIANGEVTIEDDKERDIIFFMLAFGTKLKGDEEGRKAFAKLMAKRMIQDEYHCPDKMLRAMAQNFLTEHADGLFDGVSLGMEKAK